MIIQIILLFIIIYLLNKQRCVQPTSIKRLSKILKDNDVHMCYNYNINKYCNKNKTKFLSHKNNYLINNKKYLWITLKNYYGKNIAKTITPYTFIIPNDYNSYKKFNKKIIFKKNLHRQEGLFVTDKLQDKDYLVNNGYIVAQEFIQNSLKVNNYTIAIRMYLIIECKNKVFNEYIYDDGIVYYGKNDIASYYFKYSKEIYKNNPIILSHLEKKLNINIRPTLIKKINLLVNAIKDSFCKNNECYNKHNFYEIFGIDFIITNNLDAYILEVNSGPGMVHYNEVDNQLRNNIIKYYSNIIKKN